MIVSPRHIHESTIVGFRLFSAIFRENHLFKTKKSKYWRHIGIGVGRKTWTDL
ncbi:hypothetical protein NTE_01144 [Candidatus Nitrososphaera evergladensis SR1]|uniref:Uncharacterized protein n=1 Tax=Candidatus Nitrososphaera evergladensis SR1 TaxID=1459636 RepID=A0A075MQW6_9ARCH|nr:hypothetical protein NTE_00284 [Candidatus Nitrososphaera evergladensis SR1]AIF83217.1 hypothetical protein NTE_01144 [Candidatus Nitrososphaera evergladensis SR1]